jgi:hypothetical protein
VAKIATLALGTNQPTSIEAPSQIAAATLPWSLVTSVDQSQRGAVWVSAKWDQRSGNPAVPISARAISNPRGLHAHVLSPPVGCAYVGSRVGDCAVIHRGVGSMPNFLGGLAIMEFGVPTSSVLEIV